LITRSFALKVVTGSGLEAEDLQRMMENSRELLSRLP